MLGTKGGGEAIIEFSTSTYFTDLVIPVHLLISYLGVTTAVDKHYDYNIQFVRFLFSLINV